MTATVKNAKKKGMFNIMNPYEILGVREGATPEEIKKAYRQMVKKYHPDQYEDNPLKELATEKLAEVNKAYDILIKNPSSSNGSNYSNTNNSSYNSSSDSYAYTEVRNLLQRRDTDSAEAKLNAISNRTAEWYFLMGICNFNKGWFDSAKTNLETAVSMDPNNFEYRQTLNSLNMRNRNYGNTYRQTNVGASPCDCCCQLVCLDSMCECCGGDLISCC